MMPENCRHACARRKAKSYVSVSSTAALTRYNTWFVCISNRYKAVSVFRLILIGGQSDSSSVSGFAGRK
jgi:hypothetical protein